jgi:hypothetical protein
MAAEWHYSKDGKKTGPISAQELKSLADSGGLLPTDLVWKEGMSEWKQAGSINGLFLAGQRPKVPPASPQIKVPPTLPETTNRQSLADAAKGAAQYAAKQTERTKLVNLTLPSLYQALGRHAFTSPAFRAEFAEVFQQLDQVQTEQAEVKGRTPVETKSLGDKAKAMAGQAMDAAQTQKLSLRQSSLFAALGKSVYDKHEAASGPQELVKPIADSVARLAILDTELDALSSSKDGTWITPKRLVIVVGVAIVLTVLVFVVKRENPRYAETPQTDRGVGQATKSARLSDALTQDYFPMSPGAERFFIQRSYSPKKYGDEASPLTMKTEEKASRWFELPHDSRLAGKGAMRYVMYRRGNVKIRSSDADTFSMTYRKTAMGVMRCDSFWSDGGQELHYEVLHFKWGAKPGENWETTIDEKKWLFSAKYDTTETLDNFACAVVTISRSHNGQLGIRKKYWLTRGIGIIRYAEYTSVGNSWRPTVDRIYTELNSDIAPLDWESNL